jgi:DNA-binding winged helix-turn-helix (wHTH) protein/tetratricopeptide (TPR) repeat protein
MLDPGKAERVRFGDYVADLATGELFRNGTKVPLQDKPFQILALLLSRPKQLVSRHEIIRVVWPDTFVEGDLCLNVAIRRLRAALNDDSSHAKFIETVGSRGYRFVASVHGPHASNDPARNRDRPRVAIFPLKTFTKSERESFGPDLTELLIAQLRRMNPPFVVVTPEFTTERPHKSKGTLSLCREVSVDYVLVGAITESRGQVRVIVRLLNCQAQACIWAESYTRQVDDLFGIQEEVSRNIACSVIQSIPISLHPAHLQLVPPAAHENYLHGCYYLSKMNEAGIERCLPLFEEAVRECPQFALAWAALGNAYCVLERLGAIASRKAFPKVKASADKALETEDLAEARTALAYYEFFYQHDSNAAEASLLRALTINPGYPQALGAYGQLLTALGRHKDAVAMMRRACDVDPFSGYTAIMLGWTLYYARDFEGALTQLKHSMELDSSLWVGHTSAGMVLEGLGRVEEAVAEFRVAVLHSENSALAKAHLAFGLARQGDKLGAAEILKSLAKLRQKHYFSPYWMAVISTALDDRSEALNWLEIASEERCSWIVFAREDPKFDSLHSDARFRRVVDATHPVHHSGPLAS